MLFRSAQRRRAVAQAGKIGERQARRSIVDGVLRSPIDPQLRRDVLRVCEVRRVQAAAAAEGKVRAVVEARLEAVAPTGGETQPGGIAGIQEAEKLPLSRSLRSW